MKQKVVSILLAAVLALQPCMAGAAQGKAEVPETAYLEESQQMQDGNEPDREAANPGVEKEFAEEAPIEPDNGWIQVNRGVLDKNTEWNLVDEGDEQEEKSRVKAREAEIADTDTVTGAYGENITYSLDLSTGVLSFSGFGDMADSTGDASNSPFYSYQDRITSVIVGDGITSIGNFAFYRCTKLRTVSMPGSVNRIGSSVFRSCEKLKEIVIPSNVTVIGQYAFMHCYNLESISLPSGLRTIGDSAFFEAWKLAEIQIPDSVTEIGRSAFTQCYELERVTLPSGITEISDNLFFNNRKLREVVFHKGVQKIGENAFAGCALTSIEIPEGVTSIGEWAFSSCNSLAEVTLPASLTVIGANAFSGTAYEKSFSGIEFVVLGNGMLYQYNGSSTSVTVPEGVTQIADTVFKNHKEIVEMKLPESLRSIGKSVFWGCTALERVTVPEGVEWIGEDAFRGTPFLEAQEDGIVVLGKVAYAYQGQENPVQLQIPDGVVSITPFAFRFLGSIERVMIPESVTSIGEGAFLGCTALTQVSVPESVTEIGARAFGYYCVNGSSGTYLSMHIALAGYTGTAAQDYAEDTQNDVTFLPLDALSGTCGENAEWSLDSNTGALVISGSGAMKDYTSYGQELSPFMACRGFITSVTVQEGITSIGAYAFCELDKLEEVRLPGSITEIGNCAFKGCVKLDSLELPEGVSSIGSEILGGCSSLKSIEVASGNRSYCSDNGILYDREKTQLLIIPGNFPQETLRIPESVTEIGNYAASENRNLRCVYFPDELSYLGYGAFSECVSLKNLVFKGSAPSFGSYNTVNTEGITIYCGFSKQGWTDKMENLSYPREKSWVDLDELTGVQTLELEAETDTLAAGDTLKLNAKLDPALALDFEWTSSAPEIAGVASDGMLSAYRPGTVMVSVRSLDGVYQAEQRFTVTGEAYELPQVEVAELPQEALSYTSINTETMQIPCTQQNGIYFLNGNKLSFYSLSAKQVTPVYTFSGVTRSYSTGEKLYIVYQQQCTVYDLLKRKVDRTVYIPGYTATAVGADELGRIYVAADNSINQYDHRIFLFSPEGTLLSWMASGTRVYRFNGFDSTNGNFYIEVSYDYYSWGYSHPGLALRMGNVTDNVIKRVDVYSSFMESGIITREMDNIIYLCQDAYKKHQNNAVLLGGRYLTAVSVLLGVVRVMDSHSENLDICQSYLREPTEYEQESSYSDTSSIGVRTVYHEGHDSLILYENGRRLTEYDIKTGKRTAEYNAAHYVFNMFWMDETLVLIEKENDVYYVEMVDWSDPEKIEITGETTMRVGESQRLTISHNKPYKSYYEWSSKDKRTASVSENGDLTAWKAGSVEITASNISGTLRASHSVTVQEREGANEEGGVVTSNGTVSQNISLNNYQVWSRPVNSYLTERENQTLERVEYIRDRGVLVETYSKDGSRINSRTIELPLPLFGGFFAGKDYNFLVFGQKNEQESDSCEIMRTVKYSKDWRKLGEYSVYGANTYIPFDAGSLRMAETDGKLYIHTCHEMYLSSDGLHHQANMTYVVNEADMTELQSYYDVLNISQAGYVSHSFNQFVQTDGTYVYRVDHGDGGPRAIALTRADVDGEITNVRYTLPLPIQGGYGNNATGVSAGGFELSADNCLIVGNSVDQTSEENYSAAGQRNIFLTVTSKSLTKNKIAWLTDYQKTDGVVPGTPQLVKINDWQFLILWEEHYEGVDTVWTKMVTVDGDGNQISDIIKTDMRLSDCQPAVTGNGVVKWYVSDGNSVRFYTVNPYRLENVAISDSCEGSHMWNSGVFEKETSCEEGGICIYTCIRCGEKRQEIIPAGHNWSEWLRFGIREEIRWCLKCNKEEIRLQGTGGNEPGTSWDDTDEDEDGEPSTQNLPKPGTKLTAADGSVYTVVTAGSAVEFTKAGNKNAVSVSIPSTVTINKVVYQVTAIKANAFKGSKKLKKVKIPASVKTIGDNAFMNCTSLTSVVIPAKVTKIGKKAFYNCRKLKSITIKTTKLTAKKVGSKAFTKAGSSGYRKLKVKVPAKKLSAYKKLLKKKGLSPKVKVKK
ncbi:leucine-rich repeat protein [Lachnospiraceae bacterium 46-15]